MFLNIFFKAALGNPILAELLSDKNDYKSIRIL